MIKNQDEFKKPNWESKSEDLYPFMYSSRAKNSQIHTQWLTSRKVHCSATRWQYRTGQQQGSHFLQLASLISTTKLEKRHYQNSLWSCKKQLIIWSWHSAFTTHDSRSQVYRHHRCGCIISHAEGDTCTHFQDGLLHSL